MHFTDTNKSLCIGVLCGKAVVSSHQDIRQREKDVCTHLACFFGKADVTVLLMSLCYIFSVHMRNTKALKKLNNQHLASH